MYIKNLRQIIYYLEEKIEIEKNREYGFFLALKNSGDYYIIDFKYELLGNIPQMGNRAKIFIEKEESYKFLEWCSRTNHIPMIIHTHPYYKSDQCVSFSYQDHKFNQSLIKLGNKIGVENIVFIVTNCITYQMNYYKKSFKYEEEGEIKNVKEREDFIIEEKEYIIYFIRRL